MEECPAESSRRQTVFLETAAGGKFLCGWFRGGLERLAERRQQAILHKHAIAEQKPTKYKSTAKLPATSAK